VLLRMSVQPRAAAGRPAGRLLLMSSSASMRQSARHCVCHAAPAHITLLNPPVLLPVRPWPLPCSKRRDEHPRAPGPAGLCVDLCHCLPLPPAVQGGGHASHHGGTAARVWRPLGGGWLGGWEAGRRAGAPKPDQVSRNSRNSTKNPPKLPQHVMHSPPIQHPALAPRLPTLPDCAPPARRCTGACSWLLGRRSTR
jgi:hypothetical protein